VRRIDFAEIIRRVGRNGIAAIWAVAHAGIDGHAARLAADMVAIVAILRYSAGSEAHGRFLSFLLAIRGEIPSCQLPRLPLQRTLAFAPCARLHIFIRICPQKSSSISSKRRFSGMGGFFGAWLCCVVRPQACCGGLCACMAIRFVHMNAREPVNAGLLDAVLGE